MNTEFLGRRGQRGAAVIMTVGFMLLGVLCLALVVDTGRLYMEKRSLQRLADVTALSVASQKTCEDLSSGASVVGPATAALGVATKGLPRGVVVHSAICGGIQKDAEGNDSDPRIFDPTVANDVVQIVLINPVARSLVAGGLFSAAPITLRATAVAGEAGNPLARLTIRSKVANLNTGANPLLDAVLGGLLGLNNLSVASWKGIAETQVNILDLINTGKLGVGTYEQLLTTDVSVLDLLDASIDVVGQGSTAGIGLSAIKNAASGHVNLDQLGVNLGDLLGLKTGAPESAADVALNLFDLVSGSIMVASQNDPSSVATISLPSVTLPGLATAVVKAKVIEAPRLSAVGDPRDINGGQIVGTGYDPASDPDAIYVRTAQARVFASISIPALSGLSDLLSLTSLVDGPILSGLTSFLTGQPGFGLGGLVGSIVGTILCPVPILVPSCPTYNTAAVKLLPDARIDISLDVGGGEAYIADHECTSGKELTVPVKTRVASLRVGKLGGTIQQAIDNAFASTSPPSVSEPVTLLQLGSTWAKPDSCVLGVLCPSVKYNSAATCAGTAGAPCLYNKTSKKDGYVKPAAAVVLRVDSGVLGSSSSNELTFPASGRTLPEVDDALVDGDYQSVSVSGIVGSLASTVSGIGLSVYNYSGGVLGSALGLVSTLVSSLQSTLQGVISSLLSPLLDGLVNSLLKQLGLDLAQTQVAGQLTCHSDTGVRLLN